MFNGQINENTSRLTEINSGKSQKEIEEEFNKLYWQQQGLSDPDEIQINKNDINDSITFNETKDDSKIINKKNNKKGIPEAKEQFPVCKINESLDRYLEYKLEDYEWGINLLSHVNFIKNENVKANMKALNHIDNSNFKVEFAEFTYPTTALSLISYMAAEHYSDNLDDNLNDDKYQFRFNKKYMIQLVMKYLIEYHKIPIDCIKSIICGHEYSSITGKAHYQCAVHFTKNVKRSWYSVVYNYTSGTTDIQHTLNLMKANHSRALINYCKKDGDFVIYGSSELSIKITYKLNAKGEEVPDVPMTIANNSDKNPDELKRFLFNRFPGYMIQNYNNVNNAINAFCKEQLPEFKWTIPEHLEKSNNILHQAIITHVKKYFIVDDERSKALIIAGPQNTGKTKFAQSLVNHEGYTCYFRQNFEKSQEKMLEGMKLLILDDFTYMESQQHETFKALLSGEKTTLEAKWMQTPLKAGYRTIFLTNNLEFIKRICSQPDFDGRYNLVVLESPEEDYLGPEGTYRKDLNINDNWHTKSIEISSYLDEARRHNFKNGTTFTEQNRNKLEMVENDLGLKIHRGNLKMKEYADYRTGLSDVNPFKIEKINAFDKIMTKASYRMNSPVKNMVDELEDENRKLKRELEIKNRRERELQSQVNKLNEGNKYLGFRTQT